jgi:exosortase
MTSHAATPRLRLVPLAPLGVVLVALTWAYWTTLLDLAQTWHANPQYSHGFLVPVFAAILLWLRRARLDLAGLRPAWWGLVLVVAGLVLRLGAVYSYYVSLDAISLLPCVAGLVLLWGGRAGWRWAWPAVLFLGFMIPLPYTLATALSGPLQHLATWLSTYVMQTLGMPALAEGNLILVNDHKLNIEEACSGLRMLVVFFALSTGVVLAQRRHWIDQVVILASAIPIALATNVIRITATGVLYNLGMGEMANHFSHDVAGYLMPAVALGMLWLELKVLARLVVEAPAGAPRAAAGRRAAPAVPRPAVPRSRRPAPAREPNREAAAPRRTPVTAEPTRREA